MNEMGPRSAAASAPSSPDEMNQHDKVVTIRPDAASLHNKLSGDSSDELQFLSPFQENEIPIQSEEGVCSRCKKTFLQNGPKPFRTCEHCRQLQRQRSRRWQLRTKEKDGLCTRCGQLIPEEHNQFVLCPNCRMSLRSRKATRHFQGKCVHCSRALGPSDSKFKVCTRCRENDRIRRNNLEERGFCVRCAKSLANESGKTKICGLCRERRTNPNLSRNARIPNILNAAYKNGGYARRGQEQEPEEEHHRHIHHKNDTYHEMIMDDHDDAENGHDEDVLHSSQLMIPSYSDHTYDPHLSNDAVSATAAAVLTLADENKMLESNYFAVEDKANDH